MRRVTPYGEKSGAISINQSFFKKLPLIAPSTIKTITCFPDLPIQLHLIIWEFTPPRQERYIRPLHHPSDLAGRKINSESHQVFLSFYRLSNVECWKRVGVGRELVNCNAYFDFTLDYFDFFRARRNAGNVETMVYHMDDYALY
jgi:hypothetical protein